MKMMTMVTMVILVVATGLNGAAGEVVRKSLPSVVASAKKKETPPNRHPVNVTLIYERRNQNAGVQSGKPDGLEKFLEGAKEPLNRFYDEMGRRVPVVIDPKETPTETPPEESPEENPEKAQKPKDKKLPSPPRTEVHNNKGVTQVAGRDIHNHNPLFLQTAGGKRKVVVTRKIERVRRKPAHFGYIE